VTLNDPALQFKQVDWPVLFWKVPSAQLAQAETPAVAEKVPAAQLPQPVDVPTTNLN